jgi:hypothetical protein
VAIGSPDKAERLEQLARFARCQIWSGYRSRDEVEAEVYEAARAEQRDPDQARRLAERLIAGAREELAEASARWPATTSFDRLQEAFADLRAHGVVVLEAVTDHWDAAATLERMNEQGARPRGIVYFTDPDVWHAVEHGMLEMNLWHGDSANVAPGDALLDFVVATLEAHGIRAHFDEGRIETTIEWQRRVEPAVRMADVG